jgi:alkylation response protein AidB-like acyl-CoA dehydrogenase
VVRKLEDDPVGYPPAFWKQLAELGLLGLLIPKAHGGSEQTLLEAAIVYEELGRALAPSPHFPSAILGTAVLRHAGSDAQQQEWLPRLAKGEAILTPAWLEPQRGFGPEGIQLRARRRGASWVLDGTKRHVPFARAASRLVVLARSGDARESIDLFLVDPNAPGVQLAQDLTLAADTQYKVEFSGCEVPVSARIGPEGSGWSTWNAVMHDGIILCGAQAMGGAERALEITVEYAKERKQFDKPLGAFQALAHYMADAATAISGGKVVVYEAAWARSQGRPVSRLAPMAKLFACQTYRDVTATCQQIWGGVGFTVEYDIQMYFRRAKQLQLSWWDQRYLEELVAADVLDT